MKKNLIFTFFFSFFPGAGQMYQTYMKRGTSIMVLAAAMVVLGTIFKMSIFAIPFAIVYIYSFFDTYNLRNMSDEQRKNYVDNYVWANGSFKNIIPESFSIKKNKFIGYALIILGIYALVINVLGAFSDYEVVYRVLCFIERYMPTIFVSAIAIYAGTKMIKD